MQSSQGAASESLHNRFLAISVPRAERPTCKKPEKTYEKLLFLHIQNFCTLQARGHPKTFKNRVLRPPERSRGSCGTLLGSPWRPSGKPWVRLGRPWGCLGGPSWRITEKPSVFLEKTTSEDQTARKSLRDLLGKFSFRW